MTQGEPQPGRVAIVGRAGRFPGARNVEQLWRLVAEGRVATTWLTDEQLLAAGVSRRRLADPHYVRAANVLPDMECFDAGFFGFSPREAAILDPQHRHFLECAFEALEDAGHVPERFDGRIGVFAGVGMQAYFTFNLLSNPDLVDDVGLFLLRHTGNDKDFLPTRLSYLLDLHGPSVSVQTACSTGLVSVHMAIQSLLSGECDLAIAGGVTIEVPHATGYRYAEGEILSPDGLCRAFDEHSQGTVFGSGVALVVLRRLEDALADGDDVKAVILGSAINNDGARKVGYLAPSIDGQAAAAAEALGLADVDPNSVGYIEAHGTGTPIGDPIELAGLTQAYGTTGGQRQFCGIGSIKTNIGHLDTAAGTASLIKVVEALRRAQLPPVANFRQPNSRFDFAQSPFFVVDALRPWPRTTGPRRAGVNSLGVGGTNAHLLVEEAPARAPAPATDGWHVLPLSARTASSLDGLRAKWLAMGPDELPPLVDAAHTLQHGRRTFAQRCTLVARNAEDVRRALAGEATWLVREGTAGDRPPQVVFAFPGGGAQYPGAGAGMLRDAPAFREAVEQCFAAMPADAPGDLRVVMFERAFDDRDARAKLATSGYAIPALFVLEHAYAAFWRSLGVEPDRIVAHSVGEYAGAVLAGALSLADALRIVVLRGRVMDEAPAGAMTTVPADETTVRALIGDALDIAALNAPQLSVVSGTRPAIEALEARLAGSEHEAKRIHIDVAAHSRVLEPVLAAFRRGFEGVRFHPPRVPMVSSLRGGAAQDDDFCSADYWVRHLRSTVRFTQAIDAALTSGDCVVLEVGPGQTLSPLVQMAAGKHRARAVLASSRRPTDASDDLGFAMAALGGLWANGVDLDWSRVQRGPGRRVSLPTYAFEKQRHWIAPGGGRSAGDAEHSDQPASAPPLPRRERLDEWFETFAWRELPLPATAPSDRAPWLVLAADRDEPIACAVQQELTARGERFAVATPGDEFVQSTTRSGVPHFTLRPDAADDFVRLLTALPAPPGHVLDLWPLAAPGTTPLDVPTHAPQRLRFDAGFCLLQALQQLEAPAVRLVAAAAGHVVVDGERLRDSESATLHGIVGVGAREVPGLTAIRVDLEPECDAAIAARRVIAEATADGTPPELVAWRGERRLAPVRQPAPPQASTGRPAELPQRLRDSGVYVLTGGTGGIGRALALWLAERAAARVALLSRGASPDDALANAIHQRGGDVLFLAADVTDREAMSRALQTVRERFGAIHGVFHAAGAIDDAPLAGKTLASAHAVLAPKLDGARILAELLPDGSLDLFCVFSSSSVVLCPAGQVDYVAANAAVEAIAAGRSDGFAITWGVWRDLGMAERSYGVGGGAAGPHPLLGTREHLDGGEVRFTRRMDPRDDWVVGEHRVGGVAVLPGTAYVEIAAAAAHEVLGDAACELERWTLGEPMLFTDDVPRLVTVRVAPSHDQRGHELIVESRAGHAGDVLEHMRARLLSGRGATTPTTTATTTATTTPATTTAALARLTGVQPELRARGGQPRTPAGIRFGPRWHCVSATGAGQGVAAGAFELAGSFAGDLREFRAHPALLDMAATCGLELLEQRGDTQLYAPVGADRVRLFAALPQHVTARATIVAESPRRQVSFDVELRDRDGGLIAVLERLTMRAVPAGGMHAGSTTRLTDQLLARGIRAREADAVFERTLARPERAILVSSVPLDAVRLAIAEASRPRPTDRREAAPRDAAVDAPEGELEQRIAAIWQQLLGVEPIGRDDDFFAIGGHSLNAVRMLNRLRREDGVDLPLTALFEAPTVRALAQRVRGAMPDAAAGAPTPATVPSAAPAIDAASTPRADRTIPTTEAQREILAAILMEPAASLAYNLAYGWTFDGALDGEALCAACADLVHRHDSLRGTFARDGMSLTIHADVPWQVERVDLADLPTAEREAQRRALHDAAVTTPFDLAHGPMLRAMLMRLAPDQHELLLVSHHLATDGWSVGVLMRELHAGYEARLRGSAAPLPAPTSIADFVAAEQRWQSTPDAERHRRYWLGRFEAGAPAMDLATRTRPAVRTTSAGRRDDRIDGDLLLGLRRAAESIGSPLGSFVFAAFQVWLGRATGNRDVVVGMPTSGQLAHGLDDAVGHCVNFLPILSHLPPERPFAAFVRDLRQTLAEALDHQNYTYGALVRDLRLARDASRIALVPVICNIDNLIDVHRLRFREVDARFAMHPRAHEHFELFLNLLEEPDALLLSWSYNRGLFDAATIERHVARFRRLLQGLAADPQRRLDAIGALLSDSLQPASGSFDDPGATGPQTIPEVFRDVARKHADRIAVQSGERTLDYAALDRRSDALAAELLARGVRPGGLVGIASQRAPELVVAVLAVLKVGCAYVPFDRALPPDRLVFMAEDTRIPLLLGDCDPVTAHGVPTLAFVDFPTAAVDPPLVAIAGAAPAYVMYTSGTTGRPKGVVLPHRSVIRLLVDTDWLEMSERTVTLHSSAFAFDTSIIDLFAALLHGGRVVLPPDGTLSLHQLADSIQHNGVNTLWLTSGLFHAIADLRPQVFAAVEQVIVGGDVVSPVQVARVMDACPGVTVINGYGPTESNVTNSHRIRREDLATGQALPIGRAIPGTQVWVVDDQLRPVESGVQGELVIGGRGLALGYHDRPELTAEKFVTAPWDPTLRIYRSGDIAMDPGDGVIRFFGRIDGQVKIRGFRVELAEIEAALDSHPRVRQSVVVAVVPPGQNDKVLVAYVVPAGEAPTRRELADWLRDRLPEFARPQRFVTVDSLPLNQNGKVDRKALPPLPTADTGDGRDRDAARQALQGATEHAVAAIWAQLLGLPSVDAEANFFELGGHSLLAVRLVDAIEQRFAVQLPISTLLHAPDVRGLAAAIDRATATPQTAVVGDEPWDTSVVIHPGPADGPTNVPPLFLVGGVGGNVNNLYELGREVGRRRRVVGFQTRGILGHRPLSSIEAMAQDHIQWLRRHQPRGPYVLAGYSGGALTAFEMARQLRAAGDEVLQLFVFDTYAPGFAVDFRPRLQLGFWQRLRSEFELLREEGLGFFFERLHARLQNSRLRRPLRWLTRRLRPTMHRLGQVEELWRQAAAAYHGGTYDSDVVLLQTEPRALSSRLARAHDATLGWGALVPSTRLRRIDVPGDHLRMIQGENARVLADWIETCLHEPVPPIRAAQVPSPGASSSLPR